MYPNHLQKIGSLTFMANDPIIFHLLYNLVVMAIFRDNSNDFISRYFYKLFNDRSRIRLAVGRSFVLFTKNRQMDITFRMLAQIGHQLIQTYDGTV